MTIEVYQLDTTLSLLLLHRLALIFPCFLLMLFVILFILAA